MAIARQLAIEGIDAVEGGDCKKGQPLLERAEQMHHASVHLQYLARCQARSGHLVIATEMWRQIVREGAPPGASQAVLNAINEAQGSLEQTLPKLGSTTIRANADYPGLALTLDGATIPPEILGAAQVVDPGRHVLVARARGFADFEHRWTVAEGGSAEVLIALVPGTSASDVETPPGSPGGDRGEKKPGSPLVTAGWITGSAGAIAIVAGTVTLLTRNSRRDEIASNCTNESCGAPNTKYYQAASQLESDKDTVKTLTTASNILLFGGGALLVGGVTMIVIGATSKSSADTGTRGTALLAGGPGGTPGLSLLGHW